MNRIALVAALAAVGAAGIVAALLARPDDASA